jgi:hypothetical protein
VPRYIFDIHDDEFQRDEEGLECANVEKASARVMATLPDVAGLITSIDRDNQLVRVTVPNEQRSQTYAGTVTFAGARLDEAASS